MNRKGAEELLSSVGGLGSCSPFTLMLLAVPFHLGSFGLDPGPPLLKTVSTQSTSFPLSTFLPNFLSRPWEKSKANAGCPQAPTRSRTAWSQSPQLTGGRYSGLGALSALARSSLSLRELGAGDAAWRKPAWLGGRTQLVCFPSPLL